LSFIRQARATGIGDGPPEILFATLCFPSIPVD
jgi:hypothetical protein